MKYTMLLLLLFFFSGINAQKIEESPIDTFLVIDEKPYEVKMFSEYKLIQDTFELHQRLVSLNAAIDQLLKEKQVIVDKIAFFESNKSSLLKPQKPHIKPQKQPARKPKKAGN